MVLIIFSLVGCVSASKKLKLQQESLLQKDEEIKRLQGLLEKKEGIIKEKDLKIEELRKKLEGLGVFQ